MTVEETKVIDIMGIDTGTGEVVLTISDHLDWSNSVEHQNILQRKLNTYLAFVESAEILESYPQAKDRPVVFQVVFKYRPDREGRGFLHRAQKVIESAGFTLRHEVFAESYNN